MPQTKYQESESIELKKTLTKDLAKEVVSFLNARDGIIYIGVEDDGTICGIHNVDKTMRDIRDIIRDQILPSTVGLFEIGSLLEEDKTIVFVKVKKGPKLYYIKKEGRSATGCFYRDGTASTPMSEEEIEHRWKLSFANDDFLKETPASYRPITFGILKEFYIQMGLTVDNENLAENLGLKTKAGEYNKIAELLSDKNHIGLLFAQFYGNDKSSFSETIDFGGRCLLSSVEKLIDKLEVRNRGVLKIVHGRRVTTNLVDMDCLREAVYNAVCHNDWLSGGVPSAYWYSDRVEIISYGGLPFGQTKENFFKGISKPRSEGLMQILRDLDFAEHTGHGVPSIVKRYGRDVFTITDTYILVTLPFDKKVMQELKEHLSDPLFENEHLNEQADEHPE